MPREAGNLREIHSPTSKEFSAKENKDVPKASDSMLTLFCPLLSSLISRCERCDSHLPRWKSTQKGLQNILESIAAMR